MWKTKFSSHKQYLFGLPFSINAKKFHADQSTRQMFLLCLKRKVSQTFKISSCKKVFLKCVYHWHNLLRRMFFIPCDNWKTLFFMQIFCYPEVWYNCRVAAFFWNKCFERSSHFISVIHNNITMLLIPKVQIETSTRINTHRDVTIIECTTKVWCEHFKMFLKPIAVHCY